MTPAALVVLAPLAGSLPLEARARFDRLARSLELARKDLHGDVVLACGGRVSCTPASAIAGEIFASTGSSGATIEASHESLEQAGAALPGGGGWGDFLTLASRPQTGTVQLARSPFGNLPCFWMACEGYVVAATSVPLLETFAPAKLSVDWRELALFLLCPQIRNGSTCLEGICELQGGSALEIGHGRAQVREHWSPWRSAMAARPICSRDEAVEAVGRAIDHAILARCASLKTPVLLLSGGLDSSAVAASLAASGCEFAALTMVTRHRSGDERYYARAVARATGASLRECLRSTADIDWDDPTPARLVRPSAQLFRQPTLYAAHRLADETGADSILDGGGGDDLFFALRSITPLVDRLRVEGTSRGSWDTAREIALRADVDLPTVVYKALRRYWSGRVSFRWPIASHFLTPEVRALADQAIRHPWLEPPAGALPGQATHVALMVDALGLSEDDSLDPAMSTVSPLVAQPVVEAALRVRSWLWFEQRRDRVPVRRALAGRLPPAVLERTGKGTPTGFIGEIVEAHRGQLRDLLLGGLLVEHGLADRSTIDAALSGASLARDTRLAHLLLMADAERWARLWS